MCLNPSCIDDVGFVACRKCWQCRERKVDDWVGRNIAESKTAKAAHVATLTYGQSLTTGEIDHINAAVLTYSDVQKFLKRLRTAGYPCRYFAVGEYGEKKGRAHWHVIIYWQKKVPELRLRSNFDFKFWDHGFTYWDRMSPDAVRYACKYLTKNQDDEAGQIFPPMPSKKPPLGDAYFRQLAQQYIDQGISPQKLVYSFPEVKRAGEPIEFHMRGKTADNFCRYIVDGWLDKYDDYPPKSEVIWEWLDKGLREYTERHAKPEFRQRRILPSPSKAPPGGTAPVQSEGHNTWISDIDGVRHYWSYDTEGDLGWHEIIGHDPVKARIAEEQQRKQREAYRVATQGA